MPITHELKKLLLFSFLFHFGRLVFKISGSHLTIITHTNVGSDKTSLLIFSCVVVDNEMIVIILENAISSRHKISMLLKKYFSCYFFVLVFKVVLLVLMRAFLY